MQHGRQIRIDHRRLGAQHETQERTHHVTDGHLFKSGAARQLRQPALGLRELPGVGERNRDRLVSFLLSAHQHRVDRSCIDRDERASLGVETATDLLHRGVQRFGLADLKVEQSGASLGSNAQQVRKTVIDE